MLRQMEVLLSLTAQLSSERNLDRLLEQIMDATTQLLDIESCYLFRLDKKRGVLFSEIEQGEDTRSIEIPLNDGVVGSAALSGELVNISSVADDPRFNSGMVHYEGLTVHSMLCAPMKGPHGEILGVIQALNKSSGDFTEEDEMLFTALASQACVAIENAGLYKKLQEHADSLQQKVRKRTKKIREKNVELKKLNKELAAMAITDGLTGIYNRRYFNHVIVRECQLAKRHNRPTSLIIFDIDRFKEVNDSYGHQAGDYVITALTDVVKHCIRDSDILARLGGDEFVILVTVSNLEQTGNLAERLRKSIEEHGFIYASEHIPVTVSLGVAEWESQMNTDGQTLIKFADRALYQAKREGRNKVCVSGGKLRLIGNGTKA